MNHDTLYARVAIHEGERLAAYLDTKGILTVGIGHNCAVKPVEGVEKVGDKITREQSFALFTEDMDESCRGLDAHLPWWSTLDNDRQNVMAELCFNMGIGTLLTFKNTLSYVKNGMWDLAAEGLMHSKWATDVGPTRSQFLENAMRKGQYT